MINKDKFAKYRIAEEDPKYRVDDEGHYLDPEIRAAKVKQWAAQYKAKESINGYPKERFDESWERIGANPKQQLSFYDKIKEPVNGEIKYERHIPTWKDRSKEIGQGLAGFAGGTIDLGNDIANLFTDKQVNTDYRTAWKNAKALKTKNNDIASYMLRGAGEFVPEILPMAAGGKLLGKGIVYATKATKPIIKKLATGTANFINTPITKANIAGFAGAGAAHGALHTPDYTGKEVEVPWYTEIPTVMAGGIAGGAGYNAIKGSGKFIGKHVSLPSFPNKASKASKASKVSKVTENDKDLSNRQRILAWYINKANTEGLDEDFIRSALKSKIDLNALNIYKDNFRPYALAETWKSKEYGKILPSMKEKALESTKEILDKNLIEHKPHHNINHISENLSKILNDVYKNRKTKTKENFDLARSQLHPEDLIGLSKTIPKTRELYHSTNIPAAKGSSYGTINNITKDILHKTVGEKNIDTDISMLYPLSKLVDMRASINEHAKKLPFDPKYLGKNAIRILDLKKTIDEDIAEGMERGIVSNKEFLKSYLNAKNYHKEYVGPFKSSKLFNEISDSPLTGEKLNVNDIVGKSLSKKSTHHDLENLIENIAKDSPNLYVQSKAELARLKRLKLQKEIFGKKKTSTEDLLHYIEQHKHDPIFSSKFDHNTNKIPELLNKDLSPILKKYQNMKELIKEHDITTPNAPALKLTNLTPTIAGAAGLAYLHPSTTSAALGAGIGAGANLAWKGSHNYLSKHLHKNLTDKQFVNELVRLGRIKKEDKDGLLMTLGKKSANNKVIRAQIIRATTRKNEGEKWGE